MFTRLTVENLKRLDRAEIELGRAVVFVGPNNSGKTTALQAIALWELGLKAWVEKKGGSTSARERRGATLNRRDLIALPVPNTSLLWHLRHTRSGVQRDGNKGTENVLIRIGLSGVLNGDPWEQRFEFDYANPESLYCRPIGDLDEAALARLRMLAERVRVAFLPPMSGLASTEPKIEPGRIAVLIGEGQTAQVLRNLCFAAVDQESDPAAWPWLANRVKAMFGVELLRPEFIAARGEIEMKYKERGVELDISSAGRGLQQVLLLLAYLHANPRSTILLDEPDAHLEVLRQRQIYDELTQLATQQGSQIIAATHSEQVLNQAAGRDTVIAFLGKPHRVNDQGSQLRKSLVEIGFEHYLSAQAKGWVLYLEGPTDLAILKVLARRLEHPAAAALETAYVDYVESNTPPTARDRFWGLREAVPNLIGLALFDRLQRPLALQADPDALIEMTWRRREIESYVCTREALLTWAERGLDATDLFGAAESRRRREAMAISIAELESALEVQRKPSPWTGDLKVSDEFLTPLFENYLRRSGLDPAAMRKKSYYELAEAVPIDMVDPEVTEKLDAIMAVARRAPQIGDLAR